MDTTRLKTCLWGHGTALLAVMWTGSGGLESAAGRQPRVSCGRRRHLPQMAGSVSRGRWRELPRTSPTNGGLGEPRTAASSPANGGLGEQRTAENISRDRRAGGLAASGLAALAPIPPNSHADLTQARAEGRVATSMPRDQQTHRNKKKDFSKRKN